MKPAPRGAIFWGAALISAGVVILAIQQGYVSDDLLSQAGRWWPLILIGAGVAVIVAGRLGAIAVGLAGVLLGLLIGGLVGGAGSFPTACGGDDTGPLHPFEDGSFGGNSGDVELDLNCVTLEVTGGDAPEWIIEADEESASDLELSSSEQNLVIRSGDAVSLGGRRDVAVTLPADDGTNISTSLNAGEATLDLAGGRWGAVEVDANATSIRIDLSGAAVDTLEASLNAGSAGIQFSDQTDVGSVRLSANAGEFHVCVPENVGLQVTIGSDVAVGHNLDEEGLTEDGDVWRTSGYTSAETQIDIVFSGNAAAFTLNPEGGCS
ncbi:MAG: LiaI-LiaF-like domain-containing protein [Candidatus Limnocylindria bacterium]